MLVRPARSGDLPAVSQLAAELVRMHRTMLEMTAELAPAAIPGKEA